MATHTSYECDLCTHPIEFNRTRLEVTVGVLAGLPIDIGVGRTVIDLCPGCKDALATYLADRRTPNLFSSAPTATD